MKSALFQVIKRAFAKEPPLHPIDQGLARRWIKQRLAILYPELRHDPVALERAYQQLNLDPRPGREPGDDGTVFVMTLPDR